MDSNSGSARFEPTNGSDGAVIVTHLTITDNTVLREARHWTTGRRGEPCDIRDELAQADLGAFVVRGGGARGPGACGHFPDE